MIVVAGGTGTLGQRLVPRLVERGLPVRVFTRDASRARGLAQGDFEVFVGDVRDPKRVAEAVHSAAAVISAVHGFIGTGGVTPESVDRDGNAHLISAAARNGAFTLISSIGTAPDHPCELARAKHAAEENLRQSGVPYAIIRPGLGTLVPGLRGTRCAIILHGTVGMVPGQARGAGCRSTVRAGEASCSRLAPGSSREGLRWHNRAALNCSATRLPRRSWSRPSRRGWPTPGWTAVPGWCRSGFTGPVINSSSPRPRRRRS